MTLGGLTGALILGLQELPQPAQGWTVLALLAAVVLGIGSGLIRVGFQLAAAIERNTATQAELQKSVAVLAVQLENDRSATESKRAEIILKLDRILEQRHP